MIIFKPSSSPATMNGIKLDYDHLKFQRTQIYGNLMFVNHPKTIVSNYKDLITDQI